MTIMRSAALAAPILFSGYGIARLIGQSDGEYGPGFDWQVAHVLGLVSVALFGILALSVRRVASGTPGPPMVVAVAVTLLGVAATIVQLGADVINGLLASDAAELGELGTDFQSTPGMDLVIYTVGPTLLFVGLVGILALLAYAGRDPRPVPWWSAPVLLAGSLLPLPNLDLLPIAGLLMTVALLPLGKAQPAVVERHRTDAV